MKPTVYTRNMEGLGIDQIFNLAAYGVKKRKPTADANIPTADDLMAEVEEMRRQQGQTELPEQLAPVSSEEAPDSISEGTACIPCSQDHLSTCSGLLAEALRFARSDGVESTEVISRVGLCRDELNAMERVDLRPELTVSLPEWEKTLANDALNGSRGLRHDMAAIASAQDLEKVAASAQTLRTHIGESWLKGRIANMSPDEKAKVKERAEEMLNKELEQ